MDSMAVNLSSAGGTMLLNADILVLGQEVRLRPGRNIVRFEIDAVPLARNLCLWALARPVARRPDRPHRRGLLD